MIFSADNLRLIECYINKLGKDFIGNVINLDIDNCDIKESTRVM
jgi:hypothetical protein